jgi:hypothetical protein
MVIGLRFEVDNKATSDLDLQVEALETRVTQRNRLCEKVPRRLVRAKRRLIAT